MVGFSKSCPVLTSLGKMHQRIGVSQISTWLPLQKIRKRFAAQPWLSKGQGAGDGYAICQLLPRLLPLRLCQSPPFCATGSSLVESRPTRTHGPKHPSLGGGVLFLCACREHGPNTCIQLPQPFRIEENLQWPRHCRTPGCSLPPTASYFRDPRHPRQGDGAFLSSEDVKLERAFRRAKKEEDVGLIPKG